MISVSWNCEIFCETRPFFDILSTPGLSIKNLRCPLLASTGGSSLRLGCLFQPVCFGLQRAQIPDLTECFIEAWTCFKRHVEAHPFAYQEGQPFWNDVAFSLFQQSVTRS